MNKVIKGGPPAGGSPSGYPAPGARPGQPPMPAMNAQQLAEYYQQQQASYPGQGAASPSGSYNEAAGSGYRQDSGGAGVLQQAYAAQQQGGQYGGQAQAGGQYGGQAQYGQGGYPGGYGQAGTAQVGYQEPETPEIASARMQTQKQIERVREELDQKREEGRQAGREEGLQESEGLLQGMLDTRRGFFEPIEEELLQLAMKSAIKIVETLVEQSPETIISILAEALSTAMRYQKEIYIRVNPADYETLIQRKNDLLMRLSRARDLDIRSDSSITRGGFRIDSEIGTIEATLQQQMEALTRAFEEARWL